MEDIEKYKDLLKHEHDEQLTDEVAEFLRKSTKASIPQGKGKAAIWDQISSSIDETKTKKKRNINLWIISGIAAAISIIAIVSVSISKTALPNKVQVLAEANRNIEHQLPDGSSVQLNGSSQISYEGNWNRIVNLSGEAFFDVTEGERFIVKTNYGNVEVLGTSFNVFARESTFEVSCKTGKVIVSVPEINLKEELTPGKKIWTKVDTVVRTTLTKDEIGNWTTGEFYFNNRPIRDVFNEVERQYQTKIEVMNGDTLRFTGYFFKNSDLESTLDLICLPLGLSFKKQGDRYSISTRNEEL